MVPPVTALRRESPRHAWIDGGVFEIELYPYPHLIFRRHAKRVDGPASAVQKHGFGTRDRRIGVARRPADLS